MNVTLVGTAVRLVALYEAAKGLLALVAAVGFFELQGRAEFVARALLRHLHLNPANREPRILLDAVANLTDARLMLLSLGALAYAAVRFVEGYGLWRRRDWAVLFGIATGAIYVPFELWELLRERNPWALLSLVANLAVVWLLWKARRKSLRAV